MPTLKQDSVVSPVEGLVDISCDNVEGRQHLLPLKMFLYELPEDEKNLVSLVPLLVGILILGGNLEEGYRQPMEHQRIQFRKDWQDANRAKVHEKLCPDNFPNSETTCLDQASSSAAGPLFKRRCRKGSTIQVRT